MNKLFTFESFYKYYNVEKDSDDISVFGSNDGKNWTVVYPMPIIEELEDEIDD